MPDNIKGLVLGLAIGDALGVPLEFVSRKFLKENEVKNFRHKAYTEENIGVWSDDTALSICLIETLLEGFSIELLEQKMLQWYQKAHWTAQFSAPEIGVATAQALDGLEKGNTQNGATGSYANGNGALMRCAPAFLLLKEIPAAQQFSEIAQISAITHAEAISKVSCFALVKLLEYLKLKPSKALAYGAMQKELQQLFTDNTDCGLVQSIFTRIVGQKVYELPEPQIFSTGYVLHTLEASIWCFMNTKTFSEAIWKAVNLGDNTDTVASVTGALAGLYYGYSSIDTTFVTNLSEKDRILDLAQALSQKYA
jgi:ADP-ribosyl-[dinitrogen reductase] hydrolase